MTLRRIDPDALPTPHGHAQVVVAIGSTIVVTSGQLGLDTEDKLVGGDRDYRAQAHRAAMNAYDGIVAGGATPADIVRLSVFVVDPSEEDLEQVYGGLVKAAKEAGGKLTAMTLLGISRLSDPAAVIEIEATAVI